VSLAAATPQRNVEICVKIKEYKILACKDFALVKMVFRVVDYPRFSGVGWNWMYNHWAPT